MKLKVGDRIKGLSDNYSVANKQMKLAEILAFHTYPDEEHKCIEIKIIEHNDKTKIGLKCLVDNFNVDFEVVETKE